jgi:hypothetical protein
MVWSRSLISIVALTVVGGCFAKLAAEPGDHGGSSVVVALPDGGPEGWDAAPIYESDGAILEPDGGVLLDDAGRWPAPLPVCTGSASTCVQLSVAVWKGAAIITCGGIDALGPLTVVLELQVGATFQVIDHQTLQAPGLGVKFVETNVPPRQGTYRVCVTDFAGTRCADPIVTQPPPGCQCEPIGCDWDLSCNTTIYNGCDTTIKCGACANGATCDPTYHSCCPAGLEPDGYGTCVCAPPTPCVRGTFWNVATCTCEFFGG